MSNKKEFILTLEEVLGQIGSEIDVVNSRTTLGEVRKAITKLNGLLSAIRIPLQYIMLDLEATRRERDALRMALEDRD